MGDWILCWGVSDTLRWNISVLCFLREIQVHKVLWKKLITTSSVITDLIINQHVLLLKVCISVHFNRSVMSNSLRPHEPQHTRPPCPSPTPEVHSNSCPLIKSVMPSNHLILCHPLLLPPSIFPSIRVFSNESILHIRWPKYWSFSFSISPSNEYSGLISFRMDWLDLLAVQGTLKSLLEHHSSKTSILGHSAFFIVQLSHPYMTTGKTHSSCAVNGSSYHPEIDFKIYAPGYASGIVFLTIFTHLQFSNIILPHSMIC